MDQIKMKKLLVVVDMQNDFIDGSLGTEEAKKIVPAVVKKFRSIRERTARFCLLWIPIMRIIWKH